MFAGKTAVAAVLSFGMLQVGAIEGMTDAELQAKRTEWAQFKKNFRPDYSDGSRYLRPTEGNRLSKPFAVTTADGRPACRIRYRAANNWELKNANETTKKACEELQDILRMITGVTVPIDPQGSDPKLRNLPSICIGKGMFWPYRNETQVWDDLDFLRGTDGYAIREKGGDVYVYGACEKGAMNGVYALLENNTDIVFVRPNKKFGTVFTPQTNGFSLVWGNVRSRPAANVRGFWNIQDHRFWNANYGSTSWRPWGETLPVARGAHNVNWYAGAIPGQFAKEDAFKAHNEFFGMVGGKRDKPYGNMLCFTNPELKKRFAKNVVMMMDRQIGTDVAGVNFSLDDSMNWCECPECSKPFVCPDGTVLKRGDPAFMSAQYFAFVNDVADELNARHPGMRIRTLAYFQTAEPPPFKVRDNVDLQYCPYMRANDSAPVYAEENAIWLDRAARWAKLRGAKRDEMYGYNGLGLSFPRPLGHVHQRDFREYFKYLSGINAEGSATQDRDNCDRADEKPTVTALTFDYSAIEFFVMSRLYWDPEQDVEQLYKKFCYRAFREAARPMERFYGIIREEWFRHDAPSSIGETGVNATKVMVLDAGHETELRACLDEASATVRHPVAKVLVERVRERFEFFVNEVKNAKTSELSVPQIVRANPGWDDGDWKSAAVIDTLYLPWKPYSEARVPSKIDLFHDGKVLNMRILMKEDMSRIERTKNPFADREEVFGSDFELFFENGSKPGEYFLFRVDAAGNVADYLGYDPSWNRKDTRIEVKCFDDGWGILLRIPLAEIGCDLIRDNRVRAALVRIRYSGPDAAGKKDEECSSWKFSFLHKLTTFGTLVLQR